MSIFHTVKKTRVHRFLIACLLPLAVSFSGCVSAEDAWQEGFLYRKTKGGFADYTGEDAAALLVDVKDTRRYEVTVSEPHLTVAVDDKIIFSNRAFYLGPLNQTVFSLAPGKHTVRWQFSVSRYGQMTDRGNIYAKEAVFLPRTEYKFVLRFLAETNKVSWDLAETGRETLKGKPREALAAAAAALGALDGTGFPGRIDRGTSGLFKTFTPTAAVVLCQILEHGDAVRKRGAIRALGLMGPAAGFAHKRLLAAADANDPGQLHSLVWALPRIDSRGVHGSPDLLMKWYGAGNAGLKRFILASMPPYESYYVVRRTLSFVLEAARDPDPVLSKAARPVLAVFAKITGENKRFLTDYLKEYGNSPGTRADLEVCERQLREIERALTGM